MPTQGSGADAGAMAAVQELLRGNTTTYAKNDTSANGFTDGSNSTTVTVNKPPTAGTYSGNSSYVEVVVAQPQNTYFMSILGFNSVALERGMIRNRLVPFRHQITL